MGQGRLQTSGCGCLTLRHPGPSQLALLDLGTGGDPFAPYLPLKTSTAWRWQSIQRHLARSGGQAVIDSGPKETVYRILLSPAERAEKSFAAMAEHRRKHRKILLGGESTPTLQALANFLRGQKFLVTIGGREALGFLLNDPEESYDALLYAAIDDAPILGALLGALRRHKIDLTTIVYVTAAQQEEWQVAFGHRVDRIIPADTSVEALLETLHTIW